MTENKSKNILEMLEQHVISLPDRQAVIYEPGERITYRELWMLSGRIYAWLKAKGIGAEDVVMFCLPRGIGLYACIVGTLRAGAAFVLTETDNSPVRTAYIRKDSECRLFVDEKCMEEIMQTEPLEGSVRRLTNKETSITSATLPIHPAQQVIRRGFCMNTAPSKMPGNPCDGTGFP